MRDDPILIMGVPRSGTSVVAAILERCGLWLGKTGRGNKDNPAGFFENKQIRAANKEVLGQGGYDRSGVNPLPPVGWVGDARSLYENVTEKLVWQNCPSDQVWGFKDPKVLLTWPTWRAAWPKSRLVIVRRDHAAIVRSCQKASFFRRRTDVKWDKWVAAQEHRIMKAHEVSTVTLWPARLQLKDGWMDFKRACETLGLPWVPGVQDFFAERLWDR